MNRKNNLLNRILLILLLALCVSMVFGCSPSSHSDLEAKNTQTRATTTLPGTTINHSPPVFQVSNMVIKPRVPATGEPFNVSVTVANSGGPGQYQAELVIDEIFHGEDGIEIYDTKVFNQTLDIDANQTRTISFDSLYLFEGVYIVSLGKLEDYIEVGC